MTCVYAVFEAFHIHHFCLIRGRYYFFLSSRLQVVIWLAWSTQTVRIRQKHGSDSKFCSECLFQNIMTSCNRHQNKGWGEARITAGWRQPVKETHRKAASWQLGASQQLVLWPLHNVFSPTASSSSWMKLLRVMHLQSSGAGQGTFTLMKSFVLIIKDGKPSGPRPREFKKTSSGTVAFKRIPGKLPRQVCHMTLGGECQGSVLLLKTFPGSICFM